MTLNLELEERLRRAAAGLGISAEEYAVRMLHQALPLEREARQNRAAELLRRWREEGDPEEQRETGEFLIRALDEDRQSDRKLFP